MSAFNWPINPTTSGPVQYIKDGNVETVNQDTTTPSNSTPLPVINLDSSGVEVDYATEAKQDVQILELQDIEADLESIDANITTSNSTLSSIDTSLNNIEAFDFATETTLGAIDTKVAAIETDVDLIATDISNIDAEISAINQKLAASFFTLPYDALTVQTKTADGPTLIVSRIGGVSGTIVQSSEIKYDNTVSGLTAVDLQDAIDEIDALIDALPNPIYYAGTWDASTNTPTLANTDVGVEGALYRVNVAGTVDFGAGPISFEIGDAVVNNGTIWDKWDFTDQVISVNGQQGAVSLDTDDINEGVTNLYFTDERAQDAAGALATNSSKVSLTYNDALATLTADIVADSLVDADINSAAAIARSKIAAGAANRLVYNISPCGALADLPAITAARALESDANGLPVASVVTSTELSYVSGVTSSIQSQLNAKFGFTISSQNTNFTAVSNFIYLVDSSGGAITVTLPAPAANAIIEI